jgi:preprotein translocase subunit YajC
MEMRAMQFIRMGRWLSLGLLLAVTSALAQAPAGSPEQQPTPQPGMRMREGQEMGRGRALVGKITAINKNTLELTKPDGSTATVRLTDKTEFRKDRQSAKQEDFKVGDMVLVRIEDAGAQGVTALLVAGRTGGFEGREMGGSAGRGGGMMMMGEMGKDFVVGEVKSVNAPQITIVRPDNVTQTLELNEETSLRKGRESVTMADIQPGDHVFARGAMQSNVFVPKNIMVIGPEQWKRMQEMGMVPGANKPAGDAKPNLPQQ